MIRFELLRLQPAHGQDGGLVLGALGLLFLAGVLVAGALIGYWVVLHVLAGLTLSEQKLTLRLPETMDVTAKVHKPLAIGMNGMISAVVPINNDVVIPFRGDFDLDVVLKAQIPVQFEIVYQGYLPIDSMANIVATTDFNFQSVKNLQNLSFRARLPMKMRLPVTLRVPVKQTITLDYHGPLKVHANQDLKSHLVSTIPARLRVDQTIVTPVLGSIQLHAELPRDPIKLVINHADLRLRLDGARFGVTSNPDQPKRTQSPWGLPDTSPAAGPGSAP